MAIGHDNMELMYLYKKKKISKKRLVLEPLLLLTLACFSSQFCAGFCLATITNNVFRRVLNITATIIMVDLMFFLRFYYRDWTKIH